MKTLDAQKVIKGKFKPSVAAERAFYRSLQKVARNAGHIIETHVDGAKIRNNFILQKALKEYSELLEPWARRQAVKLLDQVKNSNERAYKHKSKTIGKLIDLNVAQKEVGVVAFRLIDEQVQLIKSIPLDAGHRAQEIAYKAFLEGSRAEPDQKIIKELEKQMSFSTEEAINRARLIARTETARANASINQARATAVGSGKYKWHNSADGAVRESHRIYEGKKLQGREFFWDKPPTLDDGMTGHPGSFPNCRCFAEPVFDDE